MTHTHTSLRATSPDVARRHVAIRAQPLQTPLRCRQWYTKRRRDLLATEASRRHALHFETLLCGSHHVVRMPENTWDLEGNEACVAWTGVIESVMCVGVQCEKNLLFFNKFTTGVTFDQKGSKFDVFHPNFVHPHSYGNS